MNILAAILALLIAIYGLLFVVGGPRLANRLPDWLRRKLGMLLRAILRESIDLLNSAIASLVRFLFYRPRR